MKPIPFILLKYVLFHSTNALEALLSKTNKDQYYNLRGSSLTHTEKECKQGTSWPLQ